MGSTTKWVRRALAELGSNASDQEVKNYIREEDPSIPEGHVSLALRKLRGKVIPATKNQESASQPLQGTAQGDLFPKG
jgi:hypothetical protein